MDRINRWVVALAVFGVGITGVVPTVQAETKLNAEQIRELIVGNTIQAEHLGKGVRFKVYFDGDGKTAVREEKGKQTETTYGFVGDQHCIQWKGKNHCADIVANGDGSYMRINKKGEPVVKWTEIMPGKAL